MYLKAYYLMMSAILVPLIPKLMWRHKGLKAEQKTRGCQPKAPLVHQIPARPESHMLDPSRHRYRDGTGLLYSSGSVIRISLNPSIYVYMYICISFFRPRFLSSGHNLETSWVAVQEPKLSYHSWKACYFVYVPTMVT